LKEFLYPMDNDNINEERIIKQAGELIEGGYH
jgi:hypothetical protein